MPECQAYLADVYTVTSFRGITKLQIRNHFRKKLRTNDSREVLASVQTPLSFCFHSRSWIFRVVLCGCEIWAPTVREDSEMKVFENRMLRRTLGSHTEKVGEDGESCIITCFLIYLDQTTKGELGGPCSRHGRDEKCMNNVGWKAWR
jgi:hypothetical protein